MQNIVEKKLSEITPYEKNPRNNDNAVDPVAESIKEFGFKVPIVIDKDGVIVAGHTRYRAAKKLKLKTVPCIIADDLDDEQIKAFRLADNKVGELAEWDDELLNQQLDEIFNIDMELFGFEFIEEKEDEGNPYTAKIDIPHYEITGENPDLSDLADDQKAMDLIDEIYASDVDDDIKDFLVLAAYRHVKFNYAKIAEFYANADAEVQDLMERSALVIIDYEKAIANGYTKLSETVEEMLRSDLDEG